VKEKSCKSEAGRLEKGGKGGKSASRVGKNLKMLIEYSFIWHPRVSIFL
jgi:hypothetical protein